MMKKTLFTLLLIGCAVMTVQAQVMNQMDANGNISQTDQNNLENRNFNPNSRDSTKTNKQIPRGVWAWTVDRRFGDVIHAEVDTIPHLYQNSIFSTGMYGEYNTIGNNYSARLSRIFIDRPLTSNFLFTDIYSYTRKDPDQFHFLNTLSPYTNISYDNCGDKQNGEDHIDAKFAVNANKRLGFGFDLDYHYARGYYQNQNVSHFRASLFSSYRGDRYQMHLLATAYQDKANENGGITNDNHITHPEIETTQYSENEIPTVLQQNWNRHKSQHLFFSHRYNIGFYRKVKMTDEEIKARQFAAASAKQKAERERQKEGKEQKDESLGRKGAKVQTEIPAGRPADAKIMGDEPIKEGPAIVNSTRIAINSNESMDSILAAKAQQDSIDATIKREYVPVTSIIHTLDINNHDRRYQAYSSPKSYYANTYYDTNPDGDFGGDAINDKFCYTTVKNTFALALLEGFNKYMKAGLKAFASHEYRRYQMPELETGSTSYHMANAYAQCLNVGGQLSRRQGQVFHFDISGEACVLGEDQGELFLNFATDLNFPLFGDTVRLAAKAGFSRLVNSYYYWHYHSKHFWWDNSLDPETRTHLEGIFTYDKTNTKLRVAIDEIQNYTYLGMSYDYSTSGRTNLTGGVYQEATNINILTMQVMQNFRLGPLNWENVLTYQNSSSPTVLPLPALNLFSNLFLKFKIARVLSVELGGSMTYFTKYEAPDYLPQLNQFAIQKNGNSRIEIGGYPFFDIYANMHLKRARFFVSMTHVNAGSGSKMYFLTPHYPTNGRVLHMGVSWNFFN